MVIDPCQFLRGKMQIKYKATEYFQKIESLVNKIEDNACIRRKPLVSICCPTYNHENYITECLDGFLCQKVEFPYEIIVGDDCSTDKTQSILLDYHRKYPEKIRLRFSKTNLLSIGLKNSLGTRKACRGKYIAFCEGDDYWTDPLKLQKQVDFMESNPDYSVCAHLSDTIYETVSNSGAQYYKTSFKRDGILKKRDFRDVTKFHTSSLLIRKKFNDIFLEKDPKILRDNPLKMCLLNHGNIKVLPGVMSVYRKNPGGVSENTSIEAIYRAEIYTANMLGKELRGFFFKSLVLKSHWHRYYLSNCRTLSFKERMKLFLKFLIPSFYDFPRNLRNVLSAFYHVFVN
jgi:glycosyltransferase involved in cell wall biosynthesis